MARPKLAPDEVRNTDVCVALNEKEYSIIERRAKAVKKRIAEFLRLCGLDDKALKVIPEINAQSAQQIREILSLLTQIALYIESNQMPFLDPIFFIEMQKDLKQIHQDFLNYGDDENHQRREF